MFGTVSAASFPFWGHQSGDNVSTPSVSRSMKVASAPKRTGYFGTRVSDFEQLVVSAKVRITENEEHLADACKPDPAIAAGVTQAAYMYLGKVYVVEKLVPMHPPRASPRVALEGVPASRESTGHTALCSSAATTGGPPPRMDDSDR